MLPFMSDGYASMCNVFNINAIQPNIFPSHDLQYSATINPNSNFVMSVICPLLRAPETHCSPVPSLPVIIQVRYYRPLSCQVLGSYVIWNATASHFDKIFHNLTQRYLLPIHLHGAFEELSPKNYQTKITHLKPTFLIVLIYLL